MLSQNDLSFKLMYFDCFDKVNPFDSIFLNCDILQIQNCYLIPVWSHLISKDQTAFIIRYDIYKKNVIIYIVKF